MLQAYVDPSGKGDPNLLVIAGLIAEAETWKKFSDEWKCQLKEAGISAFKMKEFANRPEIAGWFYRLIEKHDIKAIISCTVNTAELQRVIADIKFPAYIKNIEQIRNPYYFAVKAITVVLANYNERLGFNERVDFIFDEDGGGQTKHTLWDALVESLPTDVAKYMCDKPVYQKDTEMMPLQAADLIAWWALKWAREGNTDWGKSMPFTWMAKKNIPRLVMRFERRDFLIEFSSALSLAARTPADAAYARSLLPVD